MFSLFRRNPLQNAAELAYHRIVEQARQPAFYNASGVPDTLDGRFELICLHAFLFLHRLRREEPPAPQLRQRLFDTMFADFDRSLREMGTGDLSVGREVKRMAQGFFGRTDAYERGLSGGDAVLKPALARNLFGTVTPEETALEAMAHYVRRESAQLRQQATAELLAGQFVFGQPPTTAAAPQGARAS
ncbi:MAG TPA: ubiquinol-cytochrome C chaperone family protein [Stellaceae bacterium]|nr:ubiquinol-cytochrome C chaperone family protein [Stellaceae bacterium]